jgi:acyl transferase domain-containing protein/NAD(P)-dependent dehydrogenase (short-subunit alcohol dehydrogenase family)
LKTDRAEQNIHATPPTPCPPLAIVGLGCLFPKADNVEAYWTNIKNGVDAIREIPESHWRTADYFDPNPKAPDKVYAKLGGFLDPVPFNPMEYGILPNALEAIDTSQLLGLVAVGQALKDAGYGPEREFDREKVSVILGVTGALELVIPLGARLGHPIWRSAMKEAGIADAAIDDAVQRIGDAYVPWQENSFPGLLGNVVAGRISKHFNFGGTNCVCDAACGSSLSALNLAALELATGQSDMVVTGGIDTFNDIFMYTCFSKTPALSPSGHARPFDADGDGTTLGEGLGILVLKRLADAERDGDKIYAVVKGIGTSSDGKGSAIYEPSAAGQQKALRRAYENADVEPASVGLIEAHGTGTRVGDAIEVKALREVFGEAEQPTCALGSVKSQIGHTKAAAGSAGLIKTALALHHKVLPPTIKVNKPQDAVTSGKTPFYINSETRPWLPAPNHPRRAAVSALGFGGSNFHCVLEEYRPEKGAADWSDDIQIAAFSAADRNALEQTLRQFPSAGPWSDLVRAARASRRTFDPRQNVRLALVFVREGAEPAEQIRKALAQLDKNRTQKSWTTPDGICFASGAAEAPPAVLFPGQGAQYPGMLKELALHFPAFFQRIEEADHLFPAADGPLSDFVYPRPAFTDGERQAQSERLRATEVAQPALGAVSLGAWSVLADFGLNASAFAGHSYGELTALCAAGVFDAADLHRLSRLRGELMTAGGGDKGSMLAVSAPLAEIEKALEEEKLNLVLANRNTPEQGVLSGPVAELQRAAECLGRRGLRCTALNVAAAFHSELVADAAGPFAEKLQAVDFREARTPVYANTNGAPYPADADAARALLANQLAKPVEFVQEIEALYAAGIRVFLEVGPGARLTAMVKAILGERPHQALAIDAANGKRSALLDLARALAQLAVLGQSLRLDRWDDRADEPESATGNKAGLTVAIGGANYFKRPPKRPAATRPAPVTSAATPVPPAAVAPMPVPPAAAAAVPTPAQPSNEALREALNLSRQGLQALQNLQEQTARLHQQFLTGQEQAVQSFLGLVDQQRRLFDANPTTAPAAMAIPTAQAPAWAPPVAPPVTMAPAVAPSPAVATASTAPVAPGLDSARVAEVLLAVIAEKTGYPREMLELDMALDADLGIDSIKRVEILSALQEQLPEAPTVRPDELGALQTLGQIVERLAVAAPAVAGSVATATPSAALGSNRVAEVLLAVIAEKTGYPREMLELDMALDADLGIDSIKRVEILSALQEQLPEAPTVRPDELGALQTLGQIVERLAVAAPAVATSVAAATPSAALDSHRVAEVLLAVIAEKTGYPREMLELDMALDADLGIDSIKRVEILSALQEQLPETPPIKPEHLGTLQTVAQIVDFLASVSGAPAPAPAALPAEPVAGGSVERKLLKVVPFNPKADRARLTLTGGELELWISDDGSSLARNLAARLNEQGQRTRLIPLDELDFLPAPSELAGLILLSPVAGCEDRDLLRAFRLMQIAGAGLNRVAEGGDALFVTVSRLNGGFGLSPGALPADPLSGGLAGLSKTAAHEWPKVHCKAIDLAEDWSSPEEATAALAEEILRDGPREVGLSAGGLHTLKLTVTPLAGETGELPLASGDLVVVSGGARGVTAEVAIALARAGQATLLLLGRSSAPEAEPEWLRDVQEETAIKQALLQHAETPLKPKDLETRYQSLLHGREIRATLRRIEEVGGRALYRSVDLRDSQALARVIAKAREEHGPVRGLIHGAGVLADRLIADKTLEQFETVYATKIAGLRALLDAVGDDELRFMALFSSSTGRFGRTGQVDYAVANEVLNKIAQQQARLRPHCRVLSLNWGPWDGGMVTPGLKKLFAQEGVEVIGLQAGADYLLQELATPPGGPVELVILGSCETAASEEPPAPPENIHVSKAFDLDLSVAQYPFLQSHVMDKKAVLPMAMMVEWLAHAAIHNNPGLRFHGFNDLRVMKGVTLGAGDLRSLQVLTGKAFKSDGFHVVPVELSGRVDSGRPLVHARARVVLANRLPAARAASEPLDLATYARPIGEIYRPERLFHGADFQGLTKILGCSEAGISALAKGAPAPGNWIAQPLRNSWLADPLVLDCAFQLMILWSFERYAAGSLPVFAGRYRQYAERFPEAGCEIRIQVTRQSPSTAAADMEFVDPADGRLIARIEDYECVIDASLNQSFQRNKLQGAA